VPTGPELNIENGNFEIKTGLIMMVQAIPFCGKPNEDVRAHFAMFLGTVQHLHHTRSGGRCYSSATVSILTPRKGEALILCEP
jgi:hypothetical protein